MRDLGQDARQLAAIGQDVVGPLEAASAPSISGDTASTTATPVASDNQPQASVGTSTTLTPTDMVICARGAADQPRP